MAFDYHYIQIDGYNVLHPRSMAEAAAEQGLPDDFWGRANSVDIPIGFEPGVAYLLVPRATANALDYDGYHIIKWTMKRDAVVLPRNTEFKQWTITDAKIVGIDGDLNAAYFLTLKDLRLRMQKSPVIDKAYNVSTPSEYGTVVESRNWIESWLNGGTVLWTWQGMLEDVWDDLPGDAGPCPTLPWTPIHNPDSWRFHGITAWQAVRMIFDACQSTIKPTSDGTAFAAVDLGTAQSSMVFSSLSTRIMRDEKPIETVAADIPETIVLTFPTRAQTKDCVEGQALEPVYKVSVATGISGAVAGSEMAVRYDLIAEFSDETRTIRNQADIDASAVSIGLRIKQRFQAAAEMFRTHAGICHEVVLGTSVNEIICRDYGDDEGCVTESVGHDEWGQPTEARTKPVREFGGLRGGCLAEDHPGRGVAFDILLGTWSSSTDKWSYAASSVKAIDWRNGVPYPGEFATGLFEARPSAAHGLIWEVVSLDCTALGSCGA